MSWILVPEPSLAGRFLLFREPGTFDGAKVTLYLETGSKV